MNDREMMEFDGRKGEIRLGKQRLSEESLRAFFGLATLGKMIRFGLKEDGKAVVIERVPEGIESIYSELSRLLEKHKDKPAEGFKEIRKTLKFAERIGLEEVENVDASTGGIPAPAEHDSGGSNPE